MTELIGTKGIYLIPKNGPTSRRHCQVCTTDDIRVLIVVFDATPRERKKKLTPVDRDTLFSHKFVIIPLVGFQVTNESTVGKDLSVLLIHHDPNDPRSLILIQLILKSATTVSPQGTENYLPNISWQRIQFKFSSVGQSFVKIRLVHPYHYLLDRDVHLSRNSIISFPNINIGEKKPLYKRKRSLILFQIISKEHTYQKVERLSTTEKEIIA